MSQANFRRCFISAPFGTDTAVLRKALEDHDILWRDATNIEAGTNWSDVLDKEISRADFVCVILPVERSENSFFELGMSYGKHKPILAFVNSEAELPREIKTLTYFRSDPTKPDAVASALRTFLEHARPKPRKQGRPVSARSDSPQLDITGIVESGADVERRTANLFRKAGFILSEGDGGVAPGRDRGVDFAVWIDELEQPLGNPILVQVKAGDFSERRLREAAMQLRTYMEKTHSHSGLLIYWDKSNREFPRVSSKWPMVFQLSGPALADLVARNELPDELVRLRNAAVHGQV
jgi:Restriction endonuclease